VVGDNGHSAVGRTHAAMFWSASATVRGRRRRPGWPKFWHGATRSHDRILSGLLLAAVESCRLHQEKSLHGGHFRRRPEDASAAQMTASVWSGGGKRGVPWKKNGILMRLHAIFC
jgi:hypothetical protein